MARTPGKEAQPEKLKKPTSKVPLAPSLRGCVSGSRNFVEPGSGRRQKFRLRLMGVTKIKSRESGLGQRANLIVSCDKFPACVHMHSSTIRIERAERHN